MKKTCTLVLSLFCIVAWAQKSAINMQRGNALSVADISTTAQEGRLMSALNNSNALNPIGTFQFYEAEFEPIYFEAYPSPSHAYVAIDFPSNTNVQFIRVLDVSGMVVATYSKWDRLLYIGHLQSGLYEVQVVQRNFMAHATMFYKR